MHEITKFPSLHIQMLLKLGSNIYTREILGRQTKTHNFRNNEIPYKWVTTKENKSIIFGSLFSQ